MGRTRLVNVCPAEPFDIVDQRHGDIAPLRHLAIPFRAALRDISRKGVAHRNAHRLFVRAQTDGIGVCVAARRVAHLWQPQSLQNRAHGGIVAHVLGAEGVELTGIPVVGVGEGLRQQADGDDGGGDDQQHGGPQGGLFVVQHALHPLLDGDLAEGQRTHRRRAGTGGAGDKGAGVGGAARRVGIFQSQLITGALHVAAQQDVGQPQGRVEPVERQQQEGQGLDDVVAPADVAALVGEHLGQVVLRQTVGEIDTGREQTQHEGRAEVAAAVDVAVKARRFTDLGPHTQVAEGHVEQHTAHAGEPQPRQHTSQGHGLAAGDTGGGLDFAGHDGHGGSVLRRGHHRRVGIVRLLLPDGVIGTDGRGFLRLKADGALDGDGQQQTQGHQRPQGAHGPAGRTAQGQAHQCHRQGDDAGLPGEGEQRGKNVIHGVPPRTGRSCGAAHRPPPPSIPCRPRRR